MNLHMRPSRVLRVMRDGKVAVCCKLNMSDPRGVEIAAMCGFDCIWIDMEHVPNDWSAIENAVRAAKVYDCDLVTRVATKGCYSDYIRPLEADSTGIMVPHLMSLEEARKIVYYTKFFPVGRRPLDGGNSDGKFCAVNEFEYLKSANQERFNIVQIEDPEPLEELDEICQLPGLDMIFYGPGDFSQGVGTPYDYTNPKIDEVRRLIAKTARKYGKFVGTVGSAANFAQLVDMGYQFINVLSDVTTLWGTYAPVAEQLVGRFEARPDTAFQG